MKAKITPIASRSESGISGLGKAYGERSFNSASLPELIYTLSEGEPIVDLLVGVPSDFRRNLQTSGRPIPVPIKLRALIDTGFSGGIIINETCVREFGLKSKGWSEVGFPRDREDRYFALYAWEVDLSITFPNPARGESNILIDPVSATVVEFINSSKAQALIGQGILQACVFTYDGNHGILKLTF
jgi:hypothetical protein